MDNTARTERQNAYGTSKEQILAAAEKLFAAQGYKTTTLKDVARLSGANTALVGYHFGSKEGLRQAVIEKQISLVQSIVDSVVGQDNQITMDSYKAMISRLLEIARTEEVYYRTCIWSIVDGGEFASSVTAIFIKPLIERIAKIIGKLNSSFTPEEQKGRAIVFLGHLNNYSKMQWHFFLHLGDIGNLEEIKAKHETTVREQMLSLIN